jgi:hypothetical protein
VYAREVPTNSDRFDLFVCHASEDKKSVARPLADLLIRRGLTVWLDELQLTIGDSLNGRIEEGLACSRFGVVIISPIFGSKKWTQRELAGLTARETAVGTKVILPVWHKVDERFVAERFPILADRLGAHTSAGLPAVAEQIVHALRRADEVVPSYSQQGSPKSRGDAGDEGTRSFVARTRRLGGLGLLVALVAAVGFTVVPGGPRADNSASLPNSVTTQTLEVSLPVGWRHSQKPMTPNLGLTDPVTLESSAEDGALVVGSARSANPSLLPESLLSKLSVKPRTEVVRLGATDFYRYRGLRFRGGKSIETAYVQPATTGLVLGICLPGKRTPVRVEAECEQILGTLILLAGSPIQLGPQPSYAVALSRSLSRLNTARVQLGRTFERASSASSQAAVALQLASAHELAADTLHAASPGPAEEVTNASLIAALGDTAKGYSEMARFARQRNTREFDRARATTTAGAARVAHTIDGLSRFGYRVAR